MVYSTGCVVGDSWRRGGWCALVGIGFRAKYYMEEEEEGEEEEEEDYDDDICKTSLEHK
jgi:hypothetical protein